ncbi:MAG: DUF2069 domain-containing protein [Pontibacterium sp.]
MADYRLKARLSRWLTVFLYAALLGIFALWHFVLAPVDEANNLIIFAIKVALLVAFLPTIISGNPRNHAWFCFVLLVYFTFTVMATANPSVQGIGIAASVVTGLLFTSAMMYARWESRYRKQLMAEQTRDNKTGEATSA